MHRDTMSRNPNRRKRFWCALWITCVLLQQCREVLLMNVLQMQNERTQLPRNQDHGNTTYDHSQLRQSSKQQKQNVLRKTEPAKYDEEIKGFPFRPGHLGKSGEPQEDSTNKVSRRSIVQRDEEVHKVVSAVKHVAKKLKFKQENAETLKASVCHKSKLKHLEHFWKRQPVVYNLYLLSSAVVASIGSCHKVMISHVEELVDNLGSEDAIELLEESVPIIESIRKITDDDTLGQEDDNRLLEPESPEKHHFKHMRHILVDSIDKVHIFSALLNKENKNETRTVASDLEEKIEETMLEYDIMSQILNIQPNKKIQKRSADTINNKHEVFRTSTEAAFKSFTSSSKKRLNKLHSKALTVIAGRYKHDTDDHHSTKVRDSSGYSTLEGKGIRNHRSVEDYESLVMIRNENFPCKLLSFCGNKLCFKPYDEQFLIDQLWVWENGYLQHRGTYKYVTRHTETDTISLQYELPSEKFTFSGRSFFLTDNSSCTIFVDDEDSDAQLKISCQKTPQVWSFTTFQEAKNSIASIACLFLIQDIETCSVVTPQNSSGMQLLVTKPIDESDMINQVWQWDQQYIRHYSSKLYLTSGPKGITPRALTLEKDTIEKWVFDDHELQMFSSTEGAVLDTTNGKVSLDTSSKSRVNLTTANESDLLNCESRGHYFAIKHAEEPCKVLCVKSESVGPDNLFRVVAVSISFVTGMLLGLMSLACTEHNKAFKIAFAVGVLSAAVCAAVIESSKLFLKEYQTVEFREFYTAKPLTCLWHDYTGKLRSADNNRVFNLESSSDGVGFVVRLNAETDQAWLFKNGTIFGNFSTSCEINLKDNKELDVQQSDTLLFSCKETASKNASWTKVYHDGTMNFRRQVVCMYFLQQTNEQKCAFLTADKNLSEPIPQVYSNEQLLDQVWYSSGNSLENVGTGESFNENISNFQKIPYDEADKIISVLTKCHHSRFFIQSENFPCKLLTVSTDAGSYKLALREYSIEMYFNQLWTSNNGHFYNIGTGKRLATHRRNLSSFEFILSNSDFIQYDDWSFENKTIKSTNSGCSLFATEVDGDIEVQCKNRTKSRWDIVPFDENFAFLKSVLCTFFIQNQNPPCTFLTANKTNELVFLEYMATDVIDDQLWFMSDGRLVNLQSGMPLTIKAQGNEITISNDESGTELKWTYLNEMLLEQNSKEYLTGFASVRLATENEVLVNKSKFWNIINSNTIANHLNTFTCHSSNTKFFFLKNQIRPCELLTATSDKHLSFEIFDEELIEKQLWYIENGRLFNVYTGNVTKFVKDKSGTFNIKISEMLIYDTEQIIYPMNDKLVHVYNTTHECFLSYIEHNGSSSLTCQFTESKASEWKRVDFNEELRNADDLICLFFLRSKLAPCEYLTGYEEKEVVKVRPRINELIDNQLFYWRNEYIVHMKTGLLLTASIDRSSEVTLQQEGTETETYYQHWSALGSQIVPLRHYYLALEVNTDIDGKVVLAKSYCENQTAWSQQWLEEPYHTLTDTYVSEPRDECIVEEKTNNTVFFIRSKAHPCLVLAGSDQGSSPYFEVFDPDDIDRFIWFRDNHHIINLKTDLALMIDFEEGSNENNVIMWQYYAFSLAQKWTRNKDDIFRSGLQNNCFLQSENLDGIVTIVSKCSELVMSDLEMVMYGEDADAISSLTCTFFIKSNAKHCELLTHIGGNRIRTRPLLTDQILHQLWYWKGKKLVNYGNNGVMIITNTSNTVKLHTSYDSRYGYSWLYTNSFFKSQQVKNAFITISETTGEIVADSILQTSPELQQWILIDRDEGVNNPSQLICTDSFKDKKLYVVRSEHDSCPLLTATDSSSIGVAKMSNSFSSNGLWMKDNSHIIHTNQRKCLSVKESVVSGTSVFLQQKYFYEKLQHWSTDDDVIKSKYTNHSQYLTFTGSKVVMANNLADNHDKQKWKWYTVEQIENNDKLLRCSRCYNKGEETASEVISYIPVFGWLYNLGRSIAYGAKNCPDIAISSLIDGIIDVALDVIVALSAGTASALAYGVKTGLKLGVKAGFNAVKTALKSMIKVTFKSMKSNILKFVRRGLKKNISGQLTRIHMKSKVVSSAIKNRFLRLKSLKSTKLFRLKSWIKKTLKFKTIAHIKDISTYKKKFKATIYKIKSSLKRIPHILQRKGEYLQNKASEKLKVFGNSLANRAEKAVKKVDDLSSTIDNIHRRCKRALGNCVKPILNDITDYKDEIPRISGNPIKNDLEELAKKHVLPDKGQVAVVGLKQGNKFIETAEETIDKLRSAGTKPKYKFPLPATNPKTYKGKDVMHTEQSLIDRIENTVKQKCKKQDPCEVILYTKLAPCNEREPPNAVPCLTYLTEQCKTWFQSSSTKCKIIFTETYLDDIFTAKMDESLASVFGRKKPIHNEFPDAIREVKKFAEQNLLNLQNRVSRVSWNLKFSERQKRIFGHAMSEAVKIAEDDISLFWLNLFGRLDDIFRDYPVKAGVKRIREQIDKEVQELIRVSLNVEAKNRITAKAIFDIKYSSGAGDSITFYRT
ncbi:uncharacterized protein LOC123523784 [Mercenaria mercenaria]|uniref:uncharacterized protein LOC123523784 n=1 Tax=Mercenaria mercenaria TaxID=6596 RepID=UPI00234F6995|nr:uncharacterized protein LOC123523784 [Mercenaria mercenaria]